MLGHKAREFRPLTAVTLEDLIPNVNFYRQEERPPINVLVMGRQTVRCLL